MNNIKPKYYDLIISIGQNCSTASALKELHFRSFAAPFDWLQTDNYHKAIELIKNRFENFFHIEDLEFLCVDPVSYEDVYKNKRTGLTYIHDFPSNSCENFMYYYNIALNKYNRRIKRLLKALTRCRRVCLIYIEFDLLSKNNIGVTNEIIKQNIKELNDIYEKVYFDILYIKHDKNIGLNEYKTNDKIIYINNSILCPGKDSYKGNYKMLCEIIAKQIKPSLYFYINKFLTNIKRLINLLMIINIYSQK